MQPLVRGLFRILRGHRSVARPPTPWFVRSASLATEPDVLPVIVPRSSSSPTATATGGPDGSPRPASAHGPRAPIDPCSCSSLSVLPIPRTFGFSRGGSELHRPASAASRCSVVDRRVASFVVFGRSADNQYATSAGDSVSVVANGADPPVDLLRASWFAAARLASLF